MSVISVVPPAVIVICVPSTVNTAVFVVSFPAASFANAEIICCPSPNEYAVVSYTLLICSPSKVTTNVSKVWSSITFGPNVRFPLNTLPSSTPRSISGALLSTINVTSLVLSPLVTFNVCSPSENLVVSICVPTAVTSVAGIEKLASIYGHIPVESPI